MEVPLSIKDWEGHSWHATCFCAGAMSWFEPSPHILNSSCSFAPSGVFSKKRQIIMDPTPPSPHPKWMLGIMRCSVSCVLLLGCNGLSTPAENCHHLLTRAKPMPYLKPPIIVLQKRKSCRKHPLPGYTHTHTHTIWLTASKKKKTTITHTYRHSIMQHSCFHAAAIVLLVMSPGYVIREVTYCPLRVTWTDGKLYLRTCHLQFRNESDMVCLRTAERCSANIVTE